MKRLAIAASLALIAASPAHARSHRHHHPRAYSARHAGDPRPSAWCGFFMRHLMGVADRSFNLAIRWRDFGRPASGPAPGVIGVQRNHVFRVVSVVAPGRVLAISGNDSHAVRTRIRSTRNVIAWRIP